jgi:hypothetical protein
MRTVMLVAPCLILDGAIVLTRHIKKLENIR